MGRRCPSCNKFPPIEMGEPELELNEFSHTTGDEEASISGQVRLILNSGCCGDELADADLDFDIGIKHPNDGDIHNLEVVNESAESTDRYSGKEGTPMRYRKHFYGANISIDLKCKCGWTGTAMDLVEEQASGFNDL